MRKPISIVVCDPEDPRTVESLAEAVKAYEVLLTPCASAEAVRAAVEIGPVDVAVLNLQKPVAKSFGLLSEIQQKSPQTEVIFLAEFDTEILWVWMEVIQRGAYEFLPKPFDPGELKLHVLHATEKHHPVKLRKRPPAGSVKKLKPTSKENASAAGMS
jgi:DNA-binding NtrC family response regulator